MKENKTNQKTTIEKNNYKELQGAYNISKRENNN